MPNPKSFNMTVQVGNGEQTTASIEAWFLAIMSQFSDTQKAEICKKAVLIDKDAIELPVGRSPIPKQHQIIKTTSILPFGRR